MSGIIVTQSTAAVAADGPTAVPADVRERPARAPHGVLLTQSRAARQLGLKRREFELAVHLGRIRTVVDDSGGGPRVTPAELDRVRAEDGFPEALKERVRTVGTAEGAALLQITSARFTRLARLGLVVPVDFYLNRYRAVVWLYRTEELRAFAEDGKNASLLSGRTPEHLRDHLDAGLDLRPRSWRRRHLEFLLNRAHDPWARAAALASFLDPVRIAELVSDPDERAHVHRLGPVRPGRGTPDSPAAQAAARITTADDPDEIARLRTGLRQALAEAREHRPAPRPAAEPVAEPCAVPCPSGVPERAAACRPGRAKELGPKPVSGEPPSCEAPREPRGLLGRLRRRKH